MSKLARRLNFSFNEELPCQHIQTATLLIDAVRYGSC